jgi:tRNA A-37 threonylcarbamoyl transferase component Bud32
MNLETIDLTSNNLEGHVDAKFSRSLYRLRLGTNKLSGEIPGTISNASNLAYLELNNNHLEGNIPLNLGGCKNLTLLNLASNRLQGQVPNEIGNLKNLVVLKLQMNNFSGSIPSTFSNFTNLNALNLSYNSFSGSIPDGIMKLQNLSNMNLQANKITGVIPNSISSLMILIELNLGNNLLTGSKYSGDIPSDIGFLSELEILDLSYNNLSGQVPSSFVKLNSLTELVLAYNQLSGSLPVLPKNAAVNITGNPGLTNTNSNNMDTGSKNKRHTLLIIIVALAGALIGLCLLGVVVTLSLSKKVYRIGDKHQIINGSFITMNSIDATAIEYMKEKQDGWRITPFQALNFEVADIPQGLTEVNLVGSGGSGHVYRVTYANRYNSSTGVVAVKQIRSFGSLDEKLEREFESEARILCNIRHNNIVRLLCYLSSMESKLLVYDYMDNGSLDRWLHGDYVLRARHPMARVRPVQRVPLDWPTRLIVAVGAAQGLCYMHHECSPPIIHRDVKTSNILLDSEFRAKVADFGLARMLARAGEPNTMSAVAGSFGYMAPGKNLLLFISVDFTLILSNSAQ